MTPKMTHALAGRDLPARPNLERLKNEAKQRLEGLRAVDPRAKLAGAQFQLARDYGFTSWRELKAEVDRRALGVASGGWPDPVGDWIGTTGAAQRLAMRIRRGADGALLGWVDNVDVKLFDQPLDGLTVEDGRLAYTVTSPSAEAVYEARWDADREIWAGEYLAYGLKFPLDFARGSLPRLPVVAGLDGFWDGRMEIKGKAYRLTFRVRTDAHGTYAHLDSPDGSGTNLPVAEILRDGDQVSFVMRTARFDGELLTDSGMILGRYMRDKIVQPLHLTRRAKGAPAPRSPTPSEVILSKEALDAVAGRYRFRIGEPYVFTVEDGRLAVSVPGWPRLELAASSPTVFFYKNLDVTVTFELGADGRAERVVLTQPDRPPSTGQRE